MRTRPGLSGSLPATGWSSSLPKCRAKATCSARVMSWSRKKSTLCLSRSARISATSSGVREATPRLTFDNSAPIVHVSASTLIEPRVAMWAGAAVVSVIMFISPEVVVFVSDHEDRRACRLPGFEVAVCLRGVVEPVLLIDLDPDAPRGDVTEHFARERVLLRRIGDVVSERGPRDVERSLDRERGRIDRRDRSRRRADTHQEAAPLQTVERRWNRGLADAVIDHRNADALRELANALGDVLPTVNDHVIATVRAG